MNVTRDTQTLKPRSGGWSPFRRFWNLRLVVKLPIIIAGLALILATSLTTTAYLDSRHIMQAQAEDKFRAALQNRKVVIETYLQNIHSDLLVQAGNPTVRNALASFSLSWQALDDDARTQLQSDYITGNPNPSGERDALDRGASGSQYDLVHSKFHPYFRSMLKASGYHDIFLVGNDGTVLYSVRKETEYATNLGTGEWRDTGLAKAWRRAGALQSGQVTFEDFEAYAPSGGAAASFIATPVTGNTGEQFGTLIYQIPTEKLTELAGRTEGLGETTQTYLLGRDFRLRTLPGLQPEAQILDAVPNSPALARAVASTSLRFEHEERADGETYELMAAPIEFLGAEWIIVAEEAAWEILSPVNNMRNMLLLQAVGILLVILLVGTLFARALARPFAGVGEALKSVAGGNLMIDVPYRDRGDDVGDLARDLEDMRGKLAEAKEMHDLQDQQAADQRFVVQQLTTSIQKLAQGDLTAKAAQPFASDYEELRGAYNMAIDQLNDTMTTLLAATRQIDSNAREVETASNELSQKAIEQAASLEETAAAITELSASVKSTAESAGEADKIMNRAKQDAEASGQEVNRAMTAMDRIASSSQKITQVTSVIEDLAFQTNLLALNAGVEAARAGEAGRGFAVVASEVRALAQRSSEAAKEINTLIQESADNVTNGVELVEKAGKSFEDLIGDFEKVSQSVSGIAAAAREQSIGLSEINTAVDQLDGVTQKNAAVATQVHGTGKIMVNEASKLSQISAHFRIDGNAPQIRPAAAPHSLDQHASAQHAAPARMVANAGPGQLMKAQDISTDVWSEF